MIISESAIRKIVVQEIFQIIHEGKDTLDSQELLEMGNIAVDIINMLAEKIESTGSRDSSYISIFDETIEIALESADNSPTSSGGQLDSLQTAVGFYNSNINRFPSSIRNTIEELSNRLDVFNTGPQLFASRQKDDDKIA